MILREKDKQTLSEIFSKPEISFEVWAYGSRVNGTAHPGSDLDLVIKRKNGESIPFEILLDLTEKIKESNIPILVELRDWNSLPDNFHNQILKCYEILFENNWILSGIENTYILNDPDTNYISGNRIE